MFLKMYPPFLKNVLFTAPWQIWLFLIMTSYSASSVISDSLWPHGQRPTSLFCCCCCWFLVTLIMSNSVWYYGLQLVSLLCPWDPLGKSTRLGCHDLIHGLFQTQGLHPGLLHCRQIFYFCATTKTGPLSMGFSWQEYWSGLPCPPPDFPNPGVETISLSASALQVESLPWGSGEADHYCCCCC